MKNLKLNQNYFGEPCKVLVKPCSYVSQEEVEKIKEEYPNYEIREIGYEADRIGYRYSYAAFKKK